MIEPTITCRNCKPDSRLAQFYIKPYEVEVQGDGFINQLEIQLQVAKKLFIIESQLNLEVRNEI